ncbi:MAG: heme biosynthesis protein HemY [Kiloniellales bacterium]
MWRSLLFFTKLALIVALAVWLAERPGRVEIEWLGYHIETKTGVLVVIALVFAGVVALIYRFWRFLLRAPRDLSGTLERNRRMRGYRALTRGLVAVAAGDAQEAQRLSRKAEGLLNEPPLTLLLSAQAAQLNGDETAARRFFEAMLEREETRFLGLRGLVQQSLKSGDRSAALRYAREAQALRPKTPWVATTLFELSEQQGALVEADAALKAAGRMKALPAGETTHKRAALLLEQAQAARTSGRLSEARRLVRQAVRLTPGFAPAVLLLARLLIDGGRRRKAAKVIETCWAAQPHPDLVALYLEARPAKTDLEALARVTKLAAFKPEHSESRLAQARAALAAKLWGEARRHLKAAMGSEPDPGRPRAAICRLLAELEEAEHGDAEAARQWLARAGVAPRDPTWICRNCGAATVAWQPRCGVCDTFDGLEWRAPPQATVLAVSDAAESAESAALPQPTSRAEGRAAIEAKAAG